MTVSAANLPARVVPENFRMFTVIRYVVWLGIPAHAAFVPLFIYLGYPSLALFNVFSTLSWVVGAWLNRRGQHWLAVNMVTVEVVLHAVFSVAMLGWSAGFQTYLMPMATVLMLNHRLKTRWILLEAVTLVGIYCTLYATLKDYVPPGMSVRALNAMHYANVAVVFTTLCVITYFFRDASIAAERRMEELATTDQLTKLANRRKIRERLGEEFSRAERTGREFSLIIADVDFFKKVNDTWGHDRGDDVLRLVASTLRDTAREHDLVARWGGEEFLILLPDAGPAAAVEVAERFRKSIAAQAIELEVGDLRVTMSFGVAEHGPHEDVQETVRRADAALYRAKERGRNRVELDERVRFPTAAPEPASA